jgi:hypothetical protein
VQDLLERVWGEVKALFVEETLMPVALAVARGYAESGRGEEGRVLLERVWCGEEEDGGGEFGWSVPVGIPRPRSRPHPGQEDDEDGDEDEDTGASDAYARATSLRRTALYPIGQELLRLYNEAGYTATDLDPVIPITRWALDEYRFKPAEGREDAQFVGTSSYVAEGTFIFSFRLHDLVYSIAVSVYCVAGC